MDGTLAVKPYISVKMLNKRRESTMNGKKITEVEAKSVNGGSIEKIDDKCPKCGSTSYFVEQIENHELVREAPKYIYVCRCRKCGFKWLYK